MEAAVTASKEGCGDTQGTPQVYLHANEATIIRPEESLRCREHPDVPMKVKSDGSHMTEQILQLTLEIIYLLTGEDYMVVKKTSGDHVTSHQCPIEDFHPPSLIPERNGKEILKVIKKIIELLTGEVGDVSKKFRHHNEDNCSGDPSSLDCPAVRNVTPLPVSEASDASATQHSDIVDGERLSLKCKSQNSTTAERAGNGDCRAVTLTKKQTDTVGTQSGDHLNSHQGGRSGAAKGTQTERRSTYLLVYNANTLNSQAPVTTIGATVKDCDEQLNNRSAQRRHLNCSDAPKTLPGSSSEQQIDNREARSCVEGGKLFPCDSHLTKHQQTHKGKSRDSSKSSEPFCNSDDLVEGEVEVTGSCHNGKRQTEQLGGCCDCGRSLDGCCDCGKSLDGCCDCGKSLDGCCDCGRSLDGCCDCGRSLDGCSDLGGHQVVTQEKDAACLHCGNKISYKSRLARHRKFHGGEKLFLCSECGKRFSLKSALLRHQMIHTGEKPFACAACGKCFNQRSHYIRHQLSHSGKKPFACLDCGKSFVQKSDLVKHQKGHKGRKLSCPVCRKEFCSKVFLLKHQKSHGESNRAVCSECGKCFSQKSALVVHQRIHTGEKPFPCDGCGKLFNRKSLLVRHRRVHTGEKPFSCLECGKSFTRTTNLIIHQRTHSGEKPYACPRCSKSFNSNATLLKHQRTHAEDSDVS